MLGYMEATKKRNILWDCECEIKLCHNPQREIHSAFDTIQGVVHVNPLTPKSGNFASLRIQLEGHTTTRFQTKVDNRLTNHLKDHRFLPDANSEDDSLCVYLIGKKNLTEKDRRLLPRGDNTFPFKIQLTGQQFPASYQSAFGRIQYKLVVYAIQHDRHEIPAAERSLQTRGHLDLTLDPSLGKRLVVTKKKDKSFFSKRTILQLNLLLSKRGFLPEEEINFRVVVENPTCETIVKIQVSFVQKIIFFANKVSKATRNVLGDHENNCNSQDAEIQWETGFTVPANLIPTFTQERKSIEIIYVIEFLVDIMGKPQMKGETEVVIGTTIDSYRVEEAQALHTLEMQKAGRRPSTDSNWDNVSIQTCSTLPPTYSNIISRRPSLETLPPAYAEVVGDENWEESPEEFRPRCSSNSM